MLLWNGQPVVIRPFILHISHYYFGPINDTLIPLYGKVLFHPHVTVSFNTVFYFTYKQKYNMTYVKTQKFEVVVMEILHQIFCASWLK